MAVPVIDPTTSILAYVAGEFFVYQPAAFNSPTAWSAVGLPDGVTIDEDTGKISGRATEPGVYVVPLMATNGDGTSDPLFLTIGIEAADYTLFDSSIELDVDLSTGRVTNALGSTGSNANERTAALFGKKGDKLLLSIGFKKSGVLQDLMIGSVFFGLKEFEPEQLLVLNDGMFDKIGFADSTRYQILVHFAPQKLASALSNYEADLSTYFDAPAEIRWTVMHTPPGKAELEELERSSQTFITRVERDLIPDVE